MRWLSLLTNFFTILVAHQLISTWFLFDFFVTRESLTASKLWTKSNSHPESPISRTLSLAKDVERKKCRPELTNQEATFDKLIFIIIDALGSNFIPVIDGTKHQNVGPDPMPFIMSSLRKRTAMGFVAKAATPTVTMPRVKALLSGTIPSFVDIVYNLANDVSKFDEDNIISVAKNKNKKLVFYGDDTWLSLFRRETFERVKETYSFFANDYTTVDTNVTEKALPETSADNIDWDFLLLHYLGLDHIGHNFGSNENSLIRAKLGEMDTVVQQIYDNMSKKAEHKTLIVICGDHGMSKEGNHGGGSELEANTAILFLPIGHELRAPGARLSHPHVKQVDLAATLSLLLGLNIPTMSKGVAIEPLLSSLWPSEAGESKLACAFLLNFIQVASLIDPPDLDNLSASENLISTLESHLNDRDNKQDLAKHYHRASRRIQDVLLDTIASRSYPYLLASLLIMVSAMSILNLKRTSLGLLVPTIGKTGQILCSSILVLPILLLGSTDFIEYEHKFWPAYSILALLVLCLVQKDFIRLISAIDPVIGMLFIATTLITTFRLFPRLDDLDQELDSAYLLSIVSVILMCNFIRQNSDVKKYRGLLALLIGLVIVFTKHIEESRATSDQPNDMANCALIEQLATLVVIVFSAVEIMATRTSSRLKESDGIGPIALVIRKLATGWICVAFLLARRRDFLFMMANVIMETSLNSICKSLRLPLIVRVVVYYNFAQSAFFNQGNSNSFSSIDVAPAFFGQTSYNIYFSVPLVAVATYSTQIYWLMKLFQRIQDIKTTPLTEGSSSYHFRSTTNDSAESSVKLVRNLIILRILLGSSFYMLVCMWLRDHIFIWSVLSPKLIYQYVTGAIISTVIVALSSLSNLLRLFGADDQAKSISMVKSLP